MSAADQSARLPSTRPTCLQAAMTDEARHGPELMTKRVPPAMTPRTNFAGSTSSSNVNAPPAAAIRAIAIRNDGPRPPGDATSTRRHTHQAS